jgi:Putative zinc-finger
MTERPIDAAGEHRQAWDAIPWLVNGSATAEQRRRVEAHLSSCADCRLELSRQRELHTALVDDSPSLEIGDADAGLRRLFARIDHAADEASPRSALAPRGPTQRPARSSLITWLAAAVAVEALALGALGVGLVAHTSPAPDYETLSEAARGTGATIRIVPAPSLRLEELQRMLQTLDLQIVAGPNSVGAYDLAPRSQQPLRAQQLTALRAEPGLRLVEPIDGSGAAR